MPIHTAIESAPGGVLFAVDANGDELSDALHNESESAWVWVHLAQKSQDARNWLLNESEIPASYARAMLEDKVRPRCEVSEQGILFIGRGVNLDPASVPEDVVSLRAWVEDNRIITVVVRRLRSAETIAESFASEHQRPSSPSELLALLFSQMVNRITPVVAELAEQLDDIQETVIDDDIPIADIKELSPVRLRAVTLHKYMTPMLEAANALLSAKQIRSSALIVDELTITRDRLARAVEELAAIDSRASVTRDEIISQRSDQLNQRVYVLTVLAGVCLPLSVLTGMLGMNVGGVPLAQTHWGFWITTIGMLSVMGITLGVLRLIKWI